MADLLMFTKLLLTGGGATAVDGINVTSLVGNELCWATPSDVLHLYRMNVTSGSAADGVNIIIPVVGTVGDKRWILQGDKVANGTFQDLTASKPVFTDANNKLVSTGTLGVDQGGTGVATLADGGLVIGNAAGAVDVVAAGLTTQILVGGGALTAPVWGADLPTAVTIGTAYIYRVGGTDVSVADGGTGVSTLTTAYGLLAAGTTATGTVQTLAAGATTQILVGGGASALPAWGTDIPTAVTIGGAYVYRASGTDVPVADGGTGASTFALNGVLYGNGASAIGVTDIGAEGQILRAGASPFVPAWTTATFASTYVIGGLLHAATANTIAALAPGAIGSFLMSNGSSAALSYLAAGDDGYVLVGGGVTTVPTWTASTGTGAPVRATSPTLVTPLLGTPTSGVLTNCTGLPQSAVVGLTTADGPSFAHAHFTDAIADNTATTQAATTAFAKSQDAVLAREPDQGVALTYAASGSSGIQVADNDNIDFGTGNFTLVWKGSLPLFSTYTQFINKNAGAANWFGLDITASKIRYRHADGVGTSVDVTMASAVPFVANTVHEIVAVVTRASSVAIYGDGVLLETLSAPEGTLCNLNNTGILETLGYTASAIRYAGTVHHAIIYNRALTAAEVLDLYLNGVAESDKWGSQTSLVTGDNSTFASDTGWWTKGTPWSISDGVASANGLLDMGSGTALYNNIPLIIGKKYRCTFTVKNYVSGGIAIWIHGSQEYSANGTYAEEFTATNVNFGFNRLSSASSELAIDDVLLYEIGATIALEPEGIQPAPGQWLDSSRNKLHAMQPAAGSSITRYKKDFEFRWTNTWTASSAAQYVGGLNQTVLTADHFITSIVTQATVTTDVENLELGDGSDANMFVTAFAPSATRTSQTIAAQNDGTNLKLVYTPAASATMTVETIIRGFIWEP